MLGTVADTYADVTPEIAATLRNTITTTTTLQGRQEKLNAFLKDNDVLLRHGDHVPRCERRQHHRLGKVSEPTLALLRRYSPEFPCMLKGIVNQAPLLGQTFRGFVFHISIKTLPKQPRAYTAADRPVFGADTGPYCGTLPTPPYSQDNVFKNVPNFADGVAEGNNDLKRVGTGYAQDQPSITVAGTPQEKAIMTSLAAPVMGTPADQVGDVATLLLGPLARGSEVSFR